MEKMLFNFAIKHYKKIAIGVAEQLAKINVPQFIIQGGKDGEGVQGSLMNMFLLKQLDVLPGAKK